MRGSTLVVSAILVAMFSGCFGADVHVEPQQSLAPDPSSTGSPMPTNQVPTASFELLNATGVAGVRHFTMENVTASAAASKDPDGSIANYSWRLYRYGLIDESFRERFGPEVKMKFEAPGDRTLLLAVRDDAGAVMTTYRSFSVNQHRIESGTLIAGQLPLGVGPVGARNFSLPVIDGVLALSINATFPADPSAKVRLEIRHPNGTVLNRSEGNDAPLWAIAAPWPGVVGNYTAHVSLVTGVALDYRLEYTAWYGYG